MTSNLFALLPPVARTQDGDGVLKFCLEVPGTGAGPGLETESVIIPMRNYHGDRWHTLCVSSQVGCRMGCTFCETARMGLVRNLRAAEIVSQYLTARDLMMGRGAPALIGLLGLATVGFVALYAFAVKSAGI